ncbi:MAG TPA: hypothetical protein VFG14_17995 [Chthoniobacteraceae bacterium]|nr:hypothetical protein [Chthoniobacteraceae bacterium]
MNTKTSTSNAGATPATIPISSLERACSTFLRAVLGSLMLLSLGSSAAYAAKNAVYKGVFSTADIFTGIVSTSSFYLVLAEETPVVVQSTDYTLIQGRFIALNGSLGRQRYALGLTGQFRSAEKSQTVKDSTRVTEVITLSYESEGTGATGLYHGFTGLVMFGRHSNPKYDFPLTLKGNALGSTGSITFDSPLVASATKGTLNLRLVSSLTDPIPSDETLEASVNRVLDFLKSLGYIEYVP